MSGLCVTLAVITGCRSTPEYKGDGQIKNTSYWEDNLIRVPEYTIQLASFGLATNAAREFYLGDVAFFRKTALAVRIRFSDAHDWDHFKQLPPSLKADAYIAKHKMRDINEIKSRLSYRVETTTGNRLFQSDRQLADCGWARAYPASGLTRVEIYDPEDSRMDIPYATSLKLWFSYTGDPSLTNRAELVVVCRPK